LDSPEITVTGFAAVYNDLDDEITADFLLVVVICMVAITLILGLLLRSVVAPLLIAATSLVSYIATIGIGVLVWKYALDTPLHWSVMALSFVLPAMRANIVMANTTPAVVMSPPVEPRPRMTPRRRPPSADSWPPT